MPALTTVITHATGDVYPASDWNTYNRDNVNFLITAGADLASAATIIPTNEFHGVTGVTTIDNLTPATPVAGQQVRLWIKGGPLTIRNNGAGTGNIRTYTGNDRFCRANEVLTFVYDGALWREQDAASRLIVGRVSAAGGIVAGTGFTITKLGTGNYQINFTVSFAVVPSVMAIPTDSGGPVMTSQLANSLVATCQVFTAVSNTGVFTDNAFHFLAREPF